MRIALLLVGLASFLAVLAPAGGEEGACDMKTVEKAFYCEEHEVLLPKDLVSGKTYYVCTECDIYSDKAGTCEICDKALVKKTSGKNVCPHCYSKVEACECCVKTYFECPDCGHIAARGGECPGCEGVTMEQQTSRALIQYICDECGGASMKPGKCTDPDCENKGKPLVRTCSESGNPPHSTESAK